MADRPRPNYVTDIMPAAHAEFAEKFAGRYFATPKKMVQTAETNINAGIAAAKQIVGFPERWMREVQSKQIILMNRIYGNNKTFKVFVRLRTWWRQ